MNKRIRVNGKLYEAVAPVVEEEPETKDDVANVRNLYKYAKKIEVVNKKSADTIFDVATDLLALLANKSVGYDRQTIKRALKILRSA